MASVESCPECGEPISDGVSECPKCARRLAAEAASPDGAAAQPAAKMSKTELVLSIVLSAIFVAFCLYMLDTNPMLGLVLALLAGIIGLTGWFLVNVYRALRGLLRRKKA